MTCLCLSTRRYHPVCSTSQHRSVGSLQSVLDVARPNTSSRARARCSLGAALRCQHRPRFPRVACSKSRCAPFRHVTVSTSLLRLRQAGLVDWWLCQCVFLGAPNNAASFWERERRWLSVPARLVWNGAPECLTSLSGALSPLAELDGCDYGSAWRVRRVRSTSTRVTRSRREG